MSHEQNTTVSDVRLRLVEADDLPLLFEFESDLESNKMAFTHRRTAEDFDAHWSKILKDSSVIVRAIVGNNTLAGCTSCFESDDQHLVGYWIGKEFWGHGIATRALTLLLNEVQNRPLHARAAVNNIASIRVLEKCGFHEVRREMSPAAERYIECEEVVMKLSSK